MRLLQLKQDLLFSQDPKFTCGETMTKKEDYGAINHKVIVPIKNFHLQYSWRKKELESNKAHNFVVWI